MNSQTTETYSYDQVGNRLSSLGVSPYTHNDSNHLLSTPGVTYTYDNNGNTTTKTDASGTTTYAWDFENRLVSVTLPDQSVVSFTYDPLGRRVQKVSPSGTNVFVYDGANIIEEVDAGGSVLARYTQGLAIDEPLALFRSGATHYHQADGLGSITALSDPAGTLAATYTYDSFGSLTASTGSLSNPFRYTAREFDHETTLYYYRARYYSQTDGRFVSEDPIGFAGKDVNLYRYVVNNPQRFTDPGGLRIFDTNAPPGCLDDLLRAIRILRRAIRDNPLCNRQFCQYGADLGNLLDAVENERGGINLRFAAKDKTYVQEGLRVYVLGESLSGVVLLRPISCRMGRWQIASVLVHELAHGVHPIEMTRAESERLARQMAGNCVQLLDSPFIAVD